MNQTSLKKTILIVISVVLTLTGCFGWGAYKYYVLTYYSIPAIPYHTEDLDTLCCCPQVTIYLQPIGDFTEKEAKKIKQELILHRELLGAAFTGEIQILKSRNLTADMMNKAHTRYRAEKMLHKLEVWNEEGLPLKTHGGIVTIGLMHKDISTSLHGKKDYGIMGLSFSPGEVSIVSDYRVQPHNQLWKIATHEFLHAFYQLPHCPIDDPTCIMCDAKGHGNPRLQNHLCKKCAKAIND